MSAGDDFQGGPGKVHPKQRRASGLPSDLECNGCGGVIRHGDDCVAVIHYKVEKTTNEYGQAVAGGADAVFCLNCVDGGIEVPDGFLA